MNVIDLFTKLILYVDEHPFKFILYVVGFFLLIAIIIHLIKKLFILIMRKLNNKKKYSEKELSLHCRRDSISGQEYLANDYWIWQENKLDCLKNRYKRGEILKDGSTVIRTTIYKKEGKNCRNKREFRVYAEYTEPQTTHVGDIVGGDKIVNNGNMKLNKQDVYQIESIINNMIREDFISEEDKSKLENIQKTIENKSYSKKENKKLIDIISKYSGIISNISTTIVFLNDLIK